MVRFARECIHQMQNVLHHLTVALGPGTTDLGIRIGINSGPVTAGVLRGDRARFQLFGDTVNTTARIESSGSKNRIQISEETANLLIAGGKESWVTPRDTKINAKGKGEMQT
jgi:class 3 adenylate cyclase